MLKIKLILGSTREGRMSEKVSLILQKELSQRTDLSLETLDLRDYNLPFFDEIAGPSSLNGNFKHQEVLGWTKKINEADAFIVITGEYNHSFPAVLKNALDYAYSEWNSKPVAFVGYGGVAGGARAVEQLRMVAIELQMAPIREAIHIPMIWSAFDDQGKMVDENFASKVTKLADQLTWWGYALKNARESKFIQTLPLGTDKTLEKSAVS